nr:MAG TPA: Cytosine specific methyltransferase [Bacteriophage sp.]
MKLGSLFDGSGGFPLAACLCGITPVWASEIEPYPIAVTRSRFPKMKHLGNISTINGAEIEPVDVITFSSPCQDLSVAGKRAGLRHKANGDEETTRSGLFMEAIRIIMEMREATNGVYPRFAVWENVPGAFSSNKGRDFCIVLEEFIKIVEPEAVMPDVLQGGWARADCYRGDGWSLAYRTFDAQYWGVPQRRRRIYLVADFTGQSAGKILFEREGLRGYSAEGRTPWETVARNFAPCAGATGFDGYNCRLTDDASAAIASENHPTAVCYGIGRDAFNQGRNAKFSPTFEMELQPTLVARGPGAVQSGYTVRRLTPTECARLQGFPDRWGDVDAKSNLTGEGYRFWLGVRNTHAAINGETVKTYTRAQMLAWYSKLHTDSAEYKMWGNGIALPTALYVMQGIGNCLNNK